MDWEEHWLQREIEEQEGEVREEGEGLEEEQDEVVGLDILSYVNDS